MKPSSLGWRWTMIFPWDLHFWWGFPSSCSCNTSSWSIWRAVSFNCSSCRSSCGGVVAWWTGLRRLPDPNGDCQWYTPNLYTAVCSWKNNTQVMLASNLNALGHDKWTNNHDTSFTIDPPFGGLDYIHRFQRSKPNLQIETYNETSMKHQCR
jgi:hypothetical protein